MGIQGLRILGDFVLKAWRSFAIISMRSVLPTGLRCCTVTASGLKGWGVVTAGGQDVDAPGVLHVLPQLTLVTRYLLRAHAPRRGGQSSTISLPKPRYAQSYTAPIRSSLPQPLFHGSFGLCAALHMSAPNIMRPQPIHLDMLRYEPTATSFQHAAKKL